MKRGQILVIKSTSSLAYHATRGNSFKRGSGLWRFVKDYDRKACTNKAMWEEKENGSDNALCHSYYTSQLLSRMRAPELTGILKEGPVTQSVCSNIHLDLWENICSCIRVFPFLGLFFSSNPSAEKYDQGKRTEEIIVKQVAVVLLEY